MTIGNKLSKAEIKDFRDNSLGNKFGWDIFEEDKLIGELIFSEELEDGWFEFNLVKHDEDINLECDSSTGCSRKGLELKNKKDKAPAKEGGFRIHQMENGKVKTKYLMVDIDPYSFFQKIYYKIFGF